MLIAATPKSSCSTTHFRYEKGFFSKIRFWGFVTTSLYFFRGTQQLFSLKYLL